VKTTSKNTKRLGGGGKVGRREKVDRLRSQERNPCTEFQEGWGVGKVGGRSGWGVLGMAGGVKGKGGGGGDGGWGRGG